MALLALPVGPTEIMIIFMILVVPVIVVSSIVLVIRASRRPSPHQPPDVALSQLADLYQQGALSDQEFADAKRLLLSRPTTPTQQT